MEKDFPFGKQKIEKKKGIGLIIIIIAITTIGLLPHYWPSEISEIDKDTRAFLGAIVLALLGILLFLLKKTIVEKYVIDSLQILILVVGPIMSLIPLLSEPKLFYIFFPSFYIVVIGWFLGADHFIIGPMVKNRVRYLERDKEQNIAASVNKIIFLLLMGFSLLIFYLYFEVIVLIINHSESF